MSKNFFRLLLVVGVATLVISLFVARFGNQYTEKNAGRIVEISWDTVNVREKPSTGSPILDTLSEGDNVTLTGNSYEIFGGEGATSSWTKIQLEDTSIGWIVTESIDW